MKHSLRLKINQSIKVVKFIKKTADFKKYENFHIFDDIILSANKSKEVIP